MAGTSNEYALAFNAMFEQTPKAVFAALALSFAMRLSEDDAARAIQLCREEWATLHEQGIVPQKPIKG